VVRAMTHKRQARRRTATRKAPRARRSLPSWTVHTQRLLFVVSKGVALGIVVDSQRRGTWTVVAIETPTSKERATSVSASIQRVFDHHSHQIVGEQTTQKKAMQLAERYARWWRGSRAASFETCGCGEIGAAAARPGSHDDDDALIGLGNPIRSTPGDD
jgi:hypothetical protein